MDTDKLKSKRREKGYTQKKIAKEINMTEVSYNRKENGMREFSCSELNDVMRVLKLTQVEVIEIFLQTNLPIG